MRVRDEIKMTIQAYQTLYESSIAYGMRKTLQAEQSKAEKLNLLASLQRSCAEHDETIAQLKHTIDMKLSEEHDYAEETEANHAEQMEREKKRCQAHKDELLKKLKNIHKGTD